MASGSCTRAHDRERIGQTEEAQPADLLRLILMDVYHEYLMACLEDDVREIFWARRKYLAAVLWATINRNSSRAQTKPSQLAWPVGRATWTLKTAQ